MKVTVNNIEFRFERNPYGTHNWVAVDYNPELEDEWDEPIEYWGNHEVYNLIHHYLDHVDPRQNFILEEILHLVSRSYIDSVGFEMSLHGLSYREAQKYSIGKRVQEYQLKKLRDKQEE